MKKLINQGRRRLGVPGSPAIVLAPGEAVPVTATQIAGFQRNRTVARWLEVGTLALISEDGAVEKPKAKPKAKTGIKPATSAPVEVALPDGLTGEGVERNHLGGGWWEVYVNGFKVTDQNVRKDESLAIAAEYE